MLSKETIKKLRAVKKAILLEPEFFNQEHPPMSQDSCDTPCCIFGWMGWLFSDQDYRTLGVNDWVELSGLNHEQMLRLYSCAAGWPEPYDKSYAMANSATKRAQVAANRIEHFIATGGAA